MKKTIKYLLLLYILLVVTKIILSSFILAPSTFSDSYFYIKIARNVFHDLNLSIHNTSVGGRVLYPMLLSFSYIFNDMRLIYFFMKVINALVSSSIIFPSWLLAKEFLDKKKAFLATALIAFIPATFSFTPYIMSENLLYPLFMFAVYFIYKSFISKNLIFDILAGVFIGLCFLTKIFGLSLLLVVLITILVKKRWSRKWILVLFFVLTILPLFIRNFMISGTFVGSIAGIFEHYIIKRTFSVGFFSPDKFTLLTFLTWIILYLGLCAIATYFVFFIMNLIVLGKRIRGDKGMFCIISFLSIIFIILISANHNVLPGISYNSFLPWLRYRPMGRYVDIVLPLIIINGFIGFEFYNKNKKLFLTPFLFTLCLTLISSLLVFFPLFPVNNLSLSWMGFLNFISKSNLMPVLLLFIILFVIFYLHIKNKLTFKVVYLLLLFFIMNSLLNYGYEYYNSSVWYNSEQMQMGLWINDNVKEDAVILFDERDEGVILKLNQEGIYERFTDNIFASTVGFWINRDLRVGDVNDLNGIDYIISKHELDTPLIYREGNIYLYEVNNHLK